MLDISLDSKPKKKTKKLEEKKKPKFFFGKDLDFIDKENLKIPHEIRDNIFTVMK